MAGSLDFPLVSIYAGALNRSQHQPANEAAEGPHKEPVPEKLPPARVIAANDPGLGRQDRATRSFLFKAEIPDSSRETWWYGTIEIFAIERREITRRPPKPARDPKHDFVRLLGQNAKAGIDYSLEGDLSI